MTRKRLQAVWETACSPQNIVGLLLQGRLLLLDVFFIFPCFLKETLSTFGTVDN